MDEGRGEGGTSSSSPEALLIKITASCQTVAFFAAVFLKTERMSPNDFVALKSKGEEVNLQLKAFVLSESGSL